jgi:hypothetical protein
LVPWLSTIRSPRFEKTFEFFEIDAPVSIKPEGTWGHLAPLKPGIESLRMNTKMSRGFANVYQSVFESQQCLSYLNSSRMGGKLRAKISRSRFARFRAKI